MTAPAGLPAMTRTAATEYYGGHENKANFMGLGVINAKYDVGAEQIQRLAADLSACVRVIPLAVIFYTCNDTSPAAPTVNAIYLQSGVVVSGYAGDNPPSGYPTLLRAGDGGVQITFPATLSDDFGVVANVDLKGFSGSIVNGVGSFDYAFTDPDANTFTERVNVTARDFSASLIPDAECCARLW